jgi:hypothetical protein
LSSVEFGDEMPTTSPFSSPHSADAADAADAGLSSAPRSRKKEKNGDDDRQ